MVNNDCKDWMNSAQRDFIVITALQLTGNTN